jgi:hypothetical protein
MKVSSGVQGALRKTAELELTLSNLNERYEFSVTEA